LVRKQKTIYRWDKCLVFWSINPKAKIGKTNKVIYNARWDVVPNGVGQQIRPMRNHISLLEKIFATSHYATSMQLVVVCNYLGHVYNYKFGIV